jgi:hypothetical protein
MIDDTTPDGSELGSELATLLKEARQQINLLWASIGTTGVTPRIDEVLTTNTFDVGGVQFQTVFISAGIATDLTDITGAYDGQLVLLRATNANVTVKHNAAKIVLNGAIDFSMAVGDWLLLMNYGGDGSIIDGVWIEVTRTSWT